MRFGELIRDFNEENYGRLVDLLNTGLYKMSVDENFDGEVVEVTLPADGTEIEIPHNLKTVPKYRIIVGQSGEGLIIDGDAEWTERYIYLKLATFSVSIPAVNVNFNDIYQVGPTQTTANTLTVPAHTGTVDNEEVTAKVLIMRG